MKPMKTSRQLKIGLLLTGDILALYASLFIMLLLRYGGEFWSSGAGINFWPFTVVFAPWIIIFYIAGLYDPRRLRNDIDFLKTLAVCLVVNAVIAILFFYFIPAFGIAPKTNLFLLFVIFAIVMILWRRVFNHMTRGGAAPNQVVLVGDGETAEDIARAIKENPQLGYAIALRIPERSATQEPRLIKDAVAGSRANIIVVPRHLKREGKLLLVLYELFGNGILVMDLAAFYERVLQKVPLDDLEETWFLENIEGAGRYYDSLKRAGELVFALFVGIVLLPVEIIIAALVKLTSRGPVFIRQKRTGKNGAEFTLVKFRSMVALSPDGQAEVNGAQWSPGAADKRVTPFGKFIRASHLDELPQLWNIVRGDISFVGPRPERPEFVAKLKEQIPYYEIRLLIKPGVSGWAGVNHRADRDLGDVREKLQYDIYYLKNRSLILDAAIILRTAKLLFVNPEE
jgi:exopolysaccharide biosynthesis polyprenyl glycosylphosphotransferase